MSAIVAIDIKGAFDNIDWSHLLREIAKYKLPKYTQRMVRSFIERRRVSSGCSWVQLTRGCPQGSVLGH